MNVVKRWKAAEPVRLYLYGVVSAITVAGIAVGWLTETAAVAVSGIATAVLLAPAVEAARGKAWSPASVDAMVERLAPPSVRSAPSYIRTDDGGQLDPLDDDDGRHA